MHLSLCQLFAQLSRCIIVLAVSLLGVNANASNSETLMVSRAYDVETGDFVYQEVFTSVGQDLQVRYFNAANRLIVERDVFLPAGTISPNYSLRDFRHDSEVGVREENGQRLMYLRKPGKRKTKTKVIEFGIEPVVIDAGFNTFIVQNWSQLVEQQQPLSFKFTFPNRLLMVAMTLKPIVCEEPIAGTRCIGLSMDNWLFGLVAGDTVVRYDVESKQLLSFTGTSNIASDTGKPLKVHIDYFYRDFEQYLLGLPK